MSCCGESCTICFQPIHGRSISVDHSTPTGSVTTCYCESCWIRHTRNHSTCPDCRQPLNSDRDSDRASTITNIAIDPCPGGTSVFIDGTRIVIHPTDTVGTVLQAVGPGTDIKWSYLSFNNQPLCPTERFGSYGIPDGTFLVSTRYPDQVFINQTGMVMTLGTGPWETISTLRFKIWQQYHFRVQPLWLVLMHRRWQGLEDVQTLSFYGIGHLSTLEFRPKQTNNYDSDSW